MSMDPQMIQQMLMQGLGQPMQQSGAVGGGAAGPRMQGATTPQNMAAQLASKAMLMRALQQRQQQQQVNGAMTAANAQIAQDPTMQALQRPQPMMQIPQAPQPGPQSQ